MNSVNYDLCKMAYDSKIATLDDLRLWVEQSELTVQEYEEITGKDF